MRQTYVQEVESLQSRLDRAEADRKEAKRKMSSCDEVNRTPVMYTCSATECGIISEGSEDSHCCYGYCLIFLEVYYINKQLLCLTNTKAVFNLFETNYYQFRLGYSV